MNPFITIQDIIERLIGKQWLFSHTDKTIENLLKVARSPWFICCFWLVGQGILAVLTNRDLHTSVSWKYVSGENLPQWQLSSNTRPHRDDTVDDTIILLCAIITFFLWWLFRSANPLCVLMYTQECRWVHWELLVIDGTRILSSG